MFTDISFAPVRSDHRRSELLAEAAAFRLARLAATARRAARRHPTPGAAPVATPVVVRPSASAPTERRNAEANRRYPVSR